MLPLPTVVTSLCPLLSAEAADDFLPQVCMRVPKHSAWVPFQLDLAAYTDANGDVAETALKNTLRDCIDDGDALHDRTDWPEPMIEYDSWLNRRLAITLRGWGDIVNRRGADPQALKTLRDLEALADWICTTLHEHSQQLASQRSWCPALDQVSARFQEQIQSPAWERRWEQAIREVAVRHRNLTAISPWDVFPRGKRADLRYLDLLPVMRFSDSLSFHCDADISHWNVNDFNGFCDRVAAITQSGKGAALVAKQV